MGIIKINVRIKIGYSDILFIEREVISMKVNDETKPEAYVELIAGLERENKIQSRLIEVQSEMIKSLEEHNAELEKIISEISSI